MKTNTQIYFWAHMLDESIYKDSLNTSYLPNNENEKFKYGNVFTKDLENKLDTDKAMIEFLTTIWPKWKDYFESGLEDIIEVDGQQRDVDDWDVWKISIKDLNGGYDACEAILFEKLFDNSLFSNDDEYSLKQMFDIIIEQLAESEYDYDTLEDYGQCSYKGRYHTGGYYPDH